MIGLKSQSTRAPVIKTNSPSAIAINRNSKRDEERSGFSSNSFCCFIFFLIQLLSFFVYEVLFADDYSD